MSTEIVILVLIEYSKSTNTNNQSLAKRLRNIGAGFTKKKDFAIAHGLDSLVEIEPLELNRLG
jgi:hypothetical protein